MCRRRLHVQGRSGHKTDSSSNHLPHIRLPMSVSDDHGSPSDDQRILAWANQLDTLDYFELLGVSPEASEEALISAYHRFALAFHPDTRPNCTPEVHHAMVRIFQRGVEAHQVLTVPAAHGRYRMVRARGEKRLLQGRENDSLDLAQILPTLHEQCRSAGAKLEAQQASRAWTRNDWEQVERRLLAALRFDGQANPDVARCLSALALLRTLSEPRSSR